VEISTGALFAFLFWKYGLTIDYAIMAFYTCVFIVLLVIDLEHQLILNVIVYPMMVVALLISSLRPDGPGVIYALIGGAAAFVLFFLIAFISRGGMGWGDVKMAGLIGLATGFPQVFMALLVAVLLGGIVAIILLILRLRGRKQGIPFGPFLAIGALAALFYGQLILGWYLNVLL
jgi:leader peptidase (prepilin peptidase)/N-methyltransferase